jgi:hypothetical protein
MPNEPTMDRSGSVLMVAERDFQQRFDGGRPTVLLIAEERGHTTK